MLENPRTRIVDPGGVIVFAQHRDLGIVGTCVERLYLLTNARCAPAIHLYERSGSVHDTEILREFGGRYARCDVAMRYRG